ncbi:MAG: dihydroorotate dehydrogenase electron transfer subunit [Dehalococcoidia bacterium]
MNVEFARVVENERLYGDTYVMWFAAPTLAQAATPGQFVMLRCVEPALHGEAPPTAEELPDDPLLPRAMSIHRVREGANGPEWSILYDVVGRGTAWLASRDEGDLVFAWGPLGHGFEVHPSSQHLLLVAGGIGVAPLVWLADEAVAQGKSVTLVLGGRTHEQIIPASLLPAQVEVVIMTEDGSLGQRGLATEAFAEHLEWCDEAFACGPNAMFRAMADVLRQKRVRRPVQVLLEERMGCGTGICYGCTVETRRGMRLVCKDGPKFELREVFG